ncbi:molybdate ABC transporter permease subunit [Spirochaeta thermophila]|uniref:Transporter n=1 Tax=Winmispira thermophila (strain ATCC 49972 / DSM 6192 / RI 19.B1) TaxID=665571 RepID=E0RPC2_WINT6|nr:ABC transporter permease subunit [Spirochaeta thermophila]ADN01316.1 transporter [Spirochaeta thermophila DSM 6192]
MDRMMLMDTIVLSLKIASIATGISLLAGVVLAQVFAGKRQRGVILVEVCISVPMFLPPAVTGYFLLLLLGSHGPIGGVLERWLGVEIVFTQAAAVIAAVMVTVPIVFKSMKGHFESIEEDVLHAARMDGADEVLVLLLVKLPMAMRGLSSSVMLAFLRAMG